MHKERTVAIVVVAVIAVAAIFGLPKTDALLVVLPIVSGILAITNPTK